MGLKLVFELYTKTNFKFLRLRGIEPRSQEWKPCMIPLHQKRFSGDPDLNQGPIDINNLFLTTTVDRSTN